jgi:hypothetical protein
MNDVEDAKPLLEEESIATTTSTIVKIPVRKVQFPEDLRKKLFATEAKLLMVKHSTVLDDQVFSYIVFPHGSGTQQLPVDQFLRLSPRYMKQDDQTQTSMDEFRDFVRKEEVKFCKI